MHVQNYKWRQNDKLNTADVSKYTCKCWVHTRAHTHAHTYTHTTNVLNYTCT